MGRREIQHALAAGIFIGTVMLCGSAAAQNETVCISSSDARAPLRQLPAVPGWHGNSEMLIPIGAATLRTWMGARVWDSVAGKTPEQNADRALSNWRAPPKMDACGHPAAAVIDRHQREKLADVNGSGERVYYVGAVTDPVTGWREVLAFLPEGDKLVVFMLVGPRADVEKYYADFIGMLQRYGAEER